MDRLLPDPNLADDAPDPVADYLDDARPAPPGRPWVVMLSLIHI